MLLMFAVIFPGFPHAAESNGPYLYVFSSTSEAVTVIDTATLEVMGTRPTGFKVMWLADSMNSFDGRLLWTYGMRHVEAGGKKQLKIDVIAFDPKQLKVVKRTEVGNGPAHSVVLTPDTYPERPQLPAPKELAGDLLLADRGYFDVDYLRLLDGADARFVVRGYTSINPTVLDAFAANGTRLKPRCAKRLKDCRLPKKGTLDLDVVWGTGERAFRSRLLVS